MKKMIKTLVFGLMATGSLIAYGETQTADSPEMYTDMIRLKYADADDVTRMCNNVVNTNLVRVLPDERCNTIIVTAPKTDLATITIRRVIDYMDIKLSQVQLETVFIQVELDDDLQTGADWIERGRQKFFEDGKLNIAAIVQAAKSDSRTKILCTPTLMTLDNRRSTTSWLRLRRQRQSTATVPMPSIRGNVCATTKSPFAFFAGEVESSAAKPVPNLWRGGSDLP